MKTLSVLILFAAFLAGAEKTSAALPADVHSKIFYDTASIHFTEPVWFGVFPAVRGAFLVGELGGDLYLLEPVSGGFQKTFFGHVPAFKVTGNDGLLGLAFHPDFLNNHKYYVYYILSLGTGILEERLAKASFKGDSGSARLVLYSSFGNSSVHNGGDVHFGPDGYLYLGFGDAGNPNVYNTRAQDLHILPGKMIRIDVNTRQGGLQYGIPADNPFTGSSDTLVRTEIWAYGLRQPWRWNFDPLKGTMFVTDVGDWVQEEVDTVAKGGNYGWTRREGNTCFNSAVEYQPLTSCDTTGLIGPLQAITHFPVDLQGTSSLTGGVVFRGNPASGAYGAYISGDYITRKFYATRPVSPGIVETAMIGDIPAGVSSFGTDTLGNIYFTGYDNGIIYRLDHPDLTGVATSLFPGPSLTQRASFHAPLRIGKNWILDARDLVGIDRIRILGMSGRARMALNREQLSQPFFLEPGIYFVQGTGPHARVAFPLLLK